MKHHYLEKILDTILRIFEKRFTRPQELTAGLLLIIAGLPLVGISKLFSVGTAINFNLGFVSGHLNIDSANETLLFVAGALFTAIGMYFVYRFALSPTSKISILKENLAKYIAESKNDPSRNVLVQDAYRSIYGKSPPIDQIKHMMHSNNPDAMASDHKIAGHLVDFSGGNFTSRSHTHPLAASKKWEISYWASALISLCAYVWLVQAWLPKAISKQALIVIICICVLSCVFFITKIRVLHCISRLVGSSK